MRAAGSPWLRARLSCAWSADSSTTGMGGAGPASASAAAGGAPPDAAAVSSFWKNSATCRHVKTSPEPSAWANRLRSFAKADRARTICVCMYASLE